MNAKKLVRYDNSLNKWVDQLIRRFVENLNVTMTTLIKKKYSLENAQKQRESREYASSIIRFENAASLSVVN